MIGKLKGVVDDIGDDVAIIDVHGVGYQVFCSSRTLAELPSVGEAVSVVVETHVRESEIKLFGFLGEVERDWFRLLQKVQGVGAKVALAILATLSTSELATAIALQDKAMVARSPGVGAKVAQRIVTELKGKLPEHSDPASVLGLAAQNTNDSLPGAVSDAISALTNLGYSNHQAASAVSAALKTAGPDADSASLIRYGLKELTG